MNFRELLGGLSKQRVLINANGPEGGYTIGEFVTIGDDFISVVFSSEAVHYPIARILKIRILHDRDSYMLVEQGSRVEVQPDIDDSDYPLVLIRLSEPR